jgi:hypothetical protein
MQKTTTLVAACASLAISARVQAGSDAYRAEQEGWQVETPKAWKHVAQGGRVLFGSDTEAGMILAWFAPGATIEQMTETARQGVHEQGMVLEPSAAPSPAHVKAGKAVSVELAGRAADGTQLRAKGYGILGPSGGVALLGLTTPEQYAAMRARLDAMAQTVSFFAAKKPAGGAQLAGALCSYSGGQVSSTTRRMSFDGQGRVAWGSELVASGKGWGAFAGNQYSPSSQGTYAVTGDQVEIQFPDSVLRCAVHMRQPSGRITELQCGKQLWAAGLCE